MQHCLIISRSARALTASAKKSEFHAQVIDAFADEDTCAMATTNYCCQYTDDGFDIPTLEQSVEKILAQYPIDICVLGAGMESHINVMIKYQNQMQICANQIKVMNKVIDPFLFSELCRDLNIAYPEIAKDICPANAWLIKRIGGQGGEHIRMAYKNEKCVSNYYFQQYYSGDVRSVVFLSDGEQLEIVGFNQQFQYEHGDYPFLYAGALSILPSRTECEVIEEILNKIVNKTGLIGLCGMDYLVKQDGKLMLLEINARPPATFELHEADKSLVQAHVDSFSKKVTTYKRCREYRAYNIIYANQDTFVPLDIDWPEWVKDQPVKGSKIMMGEPICSIHAETDSVEEIQNLLNYRRQTLVKTVNSFKY